MIRRPRWAATLLLTPATLAGICLNLLKHPCHFDQKATEGATCDKVAQGSPQGGKMSLTGLSLRFVHLAQFVEATVGPHGAPGTRFPLEWMDYKHTVVVFNPCRSTLCKQRLQRRTPSYPLRFVAHAPPALSTLSTPRGWGPS